jgi:hypothetical protein
MIAAAVKVSIRQGTHMYLTHRLVAVTTRAMTLKAWAALAQAAQAVARRSDCKISLGRHRTVVCRAPFAWVWSQGLP